jgi:hypothetical protein
LNESALNHLSLFRLAKQIGVSLYEVSAKTGINIEEAFKDLASTMRERLLANNVHGSDSDDSDQLSSAFHVNGVISSADKGTGFPSIRCCGSEPSPTFV